MTDDETRTPAAPATGAGVDATAGPAGETASVAGRIEAARAGWRAAMGGREVRTCPHCGQAFARPGYLDLHLGRGHPDRLAGEDRSRFVRAEAAERTVMRELALHTKSALFALPLFLVWAATLVLMIELDANVAWIVLSTPGYVLFAGLVYVMAYGYFTGGREDYHGRT